MLHASHTTRATSFVAMLLGSLLLSAASLYATADGSRAEGLSIEGALDRAAYPDWAGDALLKFGLVGSMTVYQGFNGLIESSKFSGEHVMHHGDRHYHAVRFGQDFSGIAAGWFTYATVQDRDRSWWVKIKRMMGATLVARNGYEWMYRANRFGSPFDYRDASSNRKAVVMIGIDKNGVYDFYISGVGPQGAAIDIACLIGGIVLLWE